MKSKSGSRAKKVTRCVICRKPATRTVDGEPSCQVHAELVYENQVEDYIKEHLANNEWLALMSGRSLGKPR